MSVTLAPPDTAGLAFRPVRMSRVVALLEARQQSNLIRLATAGVVVWSGYIPLINLLRITFDPADVATPPPAAYAALVTAVCVPLLLWLAVTSLRGTHPRGQRWAAAVVVAVIFAAMPALGIDGLGATNAVVIVVLLVVRPPWSLVILSVLTAFVVSVSLALGQPDAAVFFGLGPPLMAATVAVPIWLIRAARRLEDTHAALAKDAVVRERLRITDELRPTVDAALEEIVAIGSRAQRGAGAEPGRAGAQVRALVDLSRSTLAEVRRMVTRYQEVSLRAELETAATLLEAGGVPTRLELHADILTDALTDRARADLRDSVTHLLRDRTVRACTVTVASRDGATAVELRADRAPGAGNPGDAA